MMELIPAIDLMDGQCVRLTQGDYGSKKVYSRDPLEVAKAMEDHGLRRLHVVDLDGAREGRIVNYRVLERLAARTALVIDFGGGLKRDGDLEIAFECGAQMITGGSIAVSDPETFVSWLNRFGSRKVILGADAKERRIAVNGWQDTTDCELLPFLEAWHGRGITQTVCTDIGRDGMLQGPATALYREIREALPEMYLIASGGVSSVEDLEQLEAAGIPAVIFGKALYEGRITWNDLLRFTDRLKD
ncbi:MAG: 1-(5-phosphoribosyl)-5-[(5-phosphoribosylamino)methylideneamino] imidazole-4-carboxamide isomerase [Tannerella sp.]|jgi:phosphoribosylformimino-5-aminoimidazole carboxamide ribotide isomerase|nr:1-(5-phosphoribosyl)-5-[(5-phosphoribosylamino)methylideneamino] imidazole-4-carboxamide isomerase [Tannerella sp.]